MLLKNADDKSKRLALLKDLQKSQLLDAKPKAWLEDELEHLKTGMEGERESAFHLNQHFKDSKNNAVLHDLRLVADGEIAQIDHLVINRLLDFILIETKNYSGSVVINGMGEFTMEYGRKRFGITSPIEQSRRHERILRKMLERLEITSRTGVNFKFHHVVMFHPKAVIQRPKQSEFDSSAVIKADLFPDWHRKFADRDDGVAATFVGLANIRSDQTIKEWGEKLMRQHRPEDPLVLPDFMKPRAQPVAAAPTVPEASQPTASEKRLICLHCNSKISYAEGKFCWNNSVRFRGGQYCREHQALF